MNARPYLLACLYPARVQLARGPSFPNRSGGPHRIKPQGRSQGGLTAKRPRPTQAIPTRPTGHWAGNLTGTQGGRGQLNQHDYAELEQALGAFVAPGQVFEVRLIHSGKKRIDAGYFDHPAHAATAISALQERYQGIYFTPNPVSPDLAARSYNRINAWAQLTTLDGDILSRNWLLVDIDPIRPAGISSTDEQLTAAFVKANQIANTLELEGWPRPYLNASGNGVHLMYRMSEPNNDQVRDIVALFLKCLNARFKDTICEVDTTVFNAARIWRIPGTWARKGDDIPTRPHRKAYLVQVPDLAQTVPLHRLVGFNERNADLLPKGKNGTTTAAKSTYEYPDDEKLYRGLNQQAYERLVEWVPIFFEAARPYKQGYRVASADMGLEYEEELTIHPMPMGIKYFGIADQGDDREGRRTPVGILAEILFEGDKSLAARKLADVLRAPLTEFDALPIGNGVLATLPGATSLGAPIAYNFKAIPSIADLQRKTFKKQNWIINDVLPTGNILLAARPKMRKTFLALQLAIAISTGGKFLDWQCNQGDVLFLGLEDNERRLQNRIRLLQTFEIAPPDLSGFRYWTGGVDISPTNGRQYISNPEEEARFQAAFPKGQAGVDALDDFLDMYPNTKMIVFDTLARFRDASNNRDIYQRDYDQMMPITELCNRREVLGLVVHHEKKGLAGSESGDFMEDVSGSSGITGAVDGVMSIKGRRGIQDENESRKLMLSGRDIPRDFEMDMSFDAERGGWQVAARQDARVMVKSLLTRHPFINQVEFASLLPSISVGRLRQVLTEMKYDGEIIQGRYGYCLKENALMQ